MGTAVVVGAVGVHALVQSGHATLDVKPLKIGGIVSGAGLFGAGVALLGYCPGTTLAAMGEGRRDGIAGALGMLAGAALFVRAYPRMKPLLEAGDYGKSTLPLATRTSPWPWIGAMATAVAAGALASDAPPKPRQWVDRWLRRGRGLVRKREWRHSPIVSRWIAPTSRTSERFWPTSEPPWRWPRPAWRFPDSSALTRCSRSFSGPLWPWVWRRWWLVYAASTSCGFRSAGSTDFPTGPRAPHPPLGKGRDRHRERLGQVVAPRGRVSYGELIGSAGRVRVGGGEAGSPRAERRRAMTPCSMTAVAGSLWVRAPIVASLSARMLSSAPLAWL